MKQVKGTGNDCSQKLCLNDCSQRGTCRSEGKCSCKAGYSGEDCSYKKCLNDCTQHGVCDQPSGVCKCYPGFTGTDCSEDECPKQCSHHGKCDEGCCDCETGYAGIDCSLLQCPQDCNRRGSCNYQTGDCSCFPPFFGEACEKMLPQREVVAQSEEIKASEPVPQEFLEPYFTYSRLFVGSECLSELEWREKNSDEIRKSAAALAGVPVERIEITRIDCHFRSKKPTGAQILMEQQVIEGSSSVLIEFRVAAETENDSNEIRHKLDSGFVSGAFLATLANNGVEFESFEVLADPIVGQFKCFWLMRYS